MHATQKSEEMIYDVVIVGGGASGTALLFALAAYSDAKRIALIEKYAEVGQVNSNSRNNSQTLHVGDIETHYSYKKAAEVKPASMMVAEYAAALSEERRKKIIRQAQKMVLAVGEAEVRILRDRFGKLKELFPELLMLEGSQIAHYEPLVMRGRKPGEPMLALYSPEGYAVDFGALAQSFVEEAGTRAKGKVDIKLGTEVLDIKKKDNAYRIETDRGPVFSRVVVVDTDAYSLGFAKRLGYGREFSLIPIAGTFYFTKEVLRGKVYRVQDPRMPFSAAHGDPDLSVASKTRFGPTARFFPVLEARNYTSMLSYFRESGLNRWETWKSFYAILLEPVRFRYLLMNIAYELPYFGRFFFLPEVQKIVPTLTGLDLRRAKGYGGMRLQRVDTNTKELLLGEGKIVGDNIIFNMTPSPGASVCLYNALRDGIEIERFFKGEIVFDKERMQKDLGCQDISLNADVSLKANYPS